MTGIEIKSGGFKMLRKVEPLWYELKAEQAAYNNGFLDLSAPTFDSRRTGLQGKSRAILASIAMNLPTQQAVAYCISSIDRDRIGEIESLYVRKEFRRMGVGQALIENAISWLQEKKAKAIQLNVFHGNKRAVAFYRRMGFRHRVMQMMMPEED